MPQYNLEEEPDGIYIKLSPKDYTEKIRNLERKNGTLWGIIILILVIFLVYWQMQQPSSYRSEEQIQDDIEQQYRGADF